MLIIGTHGGKRMKFYKQLKNDKIISCISYSVEVKADDLEEISKEEFDSALEEQRMKAEEENVPASEQSKDERIAELEAENAALLYQVLTGEELTDV